MTGCLVDKDAAAGYSHALQYAANRFFRAHPGEVWKVSGVLLPDGLRLHAVNGTRTLTRILDRSIDMADYIFEVLEQFRDSRLRS